MLMAPTASITRKHLPGIVIALAFATGCAADRVPELQLAAARAALGEAVSAGAPQLASREVSLAREKIALGERWIAAGDNRPALWLVEQARVDAELATMKAASFRARERAAAMTLEFRARSAVAQRTNVANLDATR